jgi:hypothetical protein
MTSENGIYSSSLPCILLKYNGTQYALFSEAPSLKLFFGADYKPETIDIPLLEGDQYNNILFDSPLIYFILELKNFLCIEKDAILEFPQLDLILHQVI